MCKAPIKSSLPANQHSIFNRPETLLVTQPTVSKHWRVFPNCSLLLKNPTVQVVTSKPQTERPQSQEALIFTTVQTQQNLSKNKPTLICRPRSSVKAGSTVLATRFGWVFVQCGFNACIHSCTILLHFNHWSVESRKAITPFTNEMHSFITVITWHSLKSESTCNWNQILIPVQDPDCRRRCSNMKPDSDPAEWSAGSLAYKHQIPHEQ